MSDPDSGISRKNLYIQDIIKENPGKYDEDTSFQWVGKRDIKYMIPYVKTVEIKSRSYSGWFSDISKPYGWDFITMAFLEGFEFQDVFEPIVLIFSTETLLNEFYQIREIIERFRILVSDNILKRDIRIDFIGDYKKKSKEGKNILVKGKISSPLDNFKIGSKELSFMKRNQNVKYFINKLVDILKGLEYNISFFLKKNEYIVIYSRSITDNYPSKRESSNVLNRMYDMVKNNSSLYPLKSKNDEIFYFDVSILKANSEFFEGKFKNNMTGKSEETRFKSQTLDYFQMYCYNYQHKIPKEIQELHSLYHVNNSAIEDYYSNNPEHFVSEIPYNIINWLPEGFELRYILDLFKLMTYYSIKDENFGLELLYIIQVNIRDFDNPITLLENIKKFSVDDQWEEYIRNLRDLIRLVEIWVKEDIIG